MSMEKIMGKASEITKFLMECVKKHPDRVSQAYPSDDFGYAKKILCWHFDGKPVLPFFATDDQLMLAFSEELEEEFGLKVVSNSEGEKRDKDIELRVGRAFDFPILSKELAEGIA